MHDTDRIEAAMRYHERTKHQFNRNVSFRQQVTFGSANSKGRTWVSSRPSSRGTDRPLLAGGVNSEP
jgi:hypothetical protein